MYPSAEKFTRFYDRHSRHPVFVPDFIDRIRTRWRDVGNIEAPGMTRAWSNLCSTLNAAMVGSLGDRWHVRQDATGTGKSESLALWAAMLPRHTEHAFSPHHGVLIVVRTIEQAETLAATINHHASDRRFTPVPVGEPTSTGVKTDWLRVSVQPAMPAHAHQPARAHHTGNDRYPPSRLTPQDMLSVPVLVVCHAAYEKGAEDPESPSGSLFRAFHLWPSSPTGYRRAVVIDEAIDFCSFTQVTLEDIDHLLRIVDTPSAIVKHRPQVEVLRRLREFLFTEVEMEMAAKEAGEPLKVLLIDGEQGEHRTEHPYQRFSLLWRRGLDSPDLSPLRDVIRNSQLDYKVLRRRDPVEKQQQADHLLKILEAASRTLHNWTFYSREDGREDLGPALYTASVLPGLCEIPSGQRPGVVVMDATADTSDPSMYTLFDAVIHRQPKVRTYRRRTLHVAWLPATGKRHLTANAKEEAPLLIANLQRYLQPWRSVFLLTFKGVAPFFAGLPHGFKALMVEHYGNVNGRNDFNLCDAGCLFGVFRYPKSWSTALYFALKGPQGWRWFYSDEGQRVRRELALGQIVAETIQGLNRTSIRRCINSEGDCPEGDEFLTLPDNAEGREILKRIRRAMPGVKVTTWQYRMVSTRHLRRTNHDQLLLEYAATLSPGKHPGQDVRKTLGIGRDAWKRLTTMIRPGSHLAEALKERGVTYASDPRRPRWGAFFIKE